MRGVTLENVGSDNIKAAERKFATYIAQSDQPLEGVTAAAAGLAPPSKGLTSVGASLYTVNLLLVWPILLLIGRLRRH